MLFQAMRDHPSHHALILGGMFGMRAMNANDKKTQAEIFEEIVIDGEKSPKIKGIDQVRFIPYS